MESKFGNIKLRLLIWVVGLIIVAAISVFIYEVIVPPITTSAAVDQFEDSDASYQVLRTSEMMKNGLSTFAVLLSLIWSVIMWWKPAGVVYKSWKEEAGF